ncbi:hypothetical protein ACLKA6_017763 [Drosophila palustris]
MTGYWSVPYPRLEPISGGQARRPDLGGVVEPPGMRFWSDLFLIPGCILERRRNGTGLRANLNRGVQENTQKRKIQFSEEAIKPVFSEDLEEEQAEPYRKQYNTADAL